MGDLEKQERNVEEQEEEKEKLLEGVAVLDFDVLCSSVALKASQGKWGKLGTMEEDEEIVFVYKIFQDIFSLDLQSYFVK
jgi:hypothetical protein